MTQELRQQKMQETAQWAMRHIPEKEVTRCLFCVFKKDKGNRQSQRPSFLTRVLGGDGGSNKVLRGSKKTGACDD